MADVHRRPARQHCIRGRCRNDPGDAKNLVLALAGATAILQLGYSTGGEIAGVVTFTVASVSVLAALLVLARAFPKRARSILDRVRSFIVNHERVLVTVLLGVLAAFFLVRGAVATAS